MASRLWTEKMAESASEREKRLAAALRDNLRRRKAQARDQASPPRDEDARPD